MTYALLAIILALIGLAAVSYTEEPDKFEKEWGRDLF
jgi:hypothetical protein